MISNIYTTSDGVRLQYYKAGESGPKLVMIHAQSTSSKSFEDVVRPLSKDMQVYLVDCPGHGGSAKDPSLYNLKSCGEAVLALITNEIGGPVAILGHSSGGLIAAYVASKSVLCTRLILEDPPFFSSSGERRKSGFNYVDLSTVCHNYIESESDEDFVLYYFQHQYAWNLFPEKTREKSRKKLTANAAKYRRKHPHDDLKVIFWPNDVFVGMNDYDPHFGEAFYNDSFNEGIDYEKLLSDIKCLTLFMKAKDEVGDDGILQGALSEEDLQHVANCIPRLEIARLKTGHGIHNERPAEFIKLVKNIVYK